MHAGQRHHGARLQSRHGVELFLLGTMICLELADQCVKFAVKPQNVARERTDWLSAQVGGSSGGRFRAEARRN